jgi:hypothetical protein
MLSTANLRARVSTGDDAHALDALRHTHVGVEYASVGGEVHTSDVVGGKRGVLYLDPSLSLTELIQNARGVVGEHLIQADVLGSLSHHPRYCAYHQPSTEQDFNFIHFCLFGVLLLTAEK